MSDIHSLAKRYARMDVSPQFQGYSGVEIVVDKETSYFAGSTAGRVLRIENEWGTKAQANAILARILGFQYQPYKTEQALLDPAAELGDGVSMNGLYSGLYAIHRKYNALMATDIEAPQDEEINHEYPFELQQDRAIARKFLAVESEFTMQSNLIAAKVSQTGGDAESFAWQLLADHFSLFAGSTEVFRVDADGARVKGVITATSGQIGGFTIGARSIYNNIPDFPNAGGISSGVYLGTDGIRLGQNFTVTPQGNVTANNMVLTGTLRLGDSTITANNLRQGASRANSGYTRWNGTSSEWETATNPGGSGRVDMFRANQISCNNIGGSGATFSSLVARDTFYLGSSQPLRLISKASASYVVGY